MRVRVHKARAERHVRKCLEARSSKRSCGHALLCVAECVRHSSSHARNSCGASEDGAGARLQQQQRNIAWSDAHLCPHMAHASVKLAHFQAAKHWPTDCRYMHAHGATLFTRTIPCRPAMSVSRQPSTNSIVNTRCPESCIHTKAVIRKLDIIWSAGRAPAPHTQVQRIASMHKSLLPLAAAALHQQARLWNRSRDCHAAVVGESSPQRGCILRFSPVPALKASA